MRYRKLAERYARALSVSISDDAAFDTAAQALRTLADALESDATVMSKLLNPSIKLEARIAAVDELLQKIDAPTEARNLAKLIMTRGRLAAIGAIADVTEELADERLGRAKVYLTTAHPLSEENEAYLRERFEKRTGKQISFRNEIDPDVIGGVRARIGDTVIDSTLRNRLVQLRESLLAQEMN